MGLGGLGGVGWVYVMINMDVHRQQKDSDADPQTQCNYSSRSPSNCATEKMSTSPVLDGCKAVPNEVANQQGFRVYRV